ncbi:hypothetical protein GCM10010317_077900 [Streptomyces mirabilis]|uniref:hypothetical protein n=1 Tax=Streptomyces mirabilis TaxID=68239 RepID=UPI00167E91AE|nr:hypothetical protein [Streptomyces mirabilis]GHD70499.1 hypothetical protein GCM10010317_077900 [Streptomyces mirabilis]
MLLDLATAVAAVNALIAKHPLLPADEIVPSSSGVSVHLHGGFADFEAWREALGIATDEVSFHVRSGNGSTMRAETEFASVLVAIVGYSGPVPAPAGVLKAVA